MRPVTTDIAVRLTAVLALLGACTPSEGDKAIDSDTQPLPDTAQAVDSDSDTVDTETVDTETVDTETVDTETETIDTEVFVVETAGIDTEVVDTEVVDTEVVDTEVVDTEVIDTEVIDTEVVDTEVVDTEVIDTEVVDTEVIETDDLDTEVIDTDTDFETDGGPFETSSPHSGGETGTFDSGFGVDLSLLAHCPTPVSWTHDTGNDLELVERTDCIPVPDAQDCPDISQPQPWFGRTLGNFCATQRTLCVTGFLGRTADVYDTGFDTFGGQITGPIPGLDRCCYTYIGVRATYDCGRPFRPAGHATVAPVLVTTTWCDAPTGPATAHPAALARWSDDAAAEHASVAAFAGVVLDLLAHGAPAEIVIAAQVAMGEEVDHARGAFAIASTLAGRALGPGPLDTARTPRSLVEVAVEAAVEGGLAEALAAATAAARLAVATEPAVRAHLKRVVDDEARHAVLGWQIVDWAIAKGGAQVAEAVDAALADAFAHHLHATLPEEPVDAAWGLPGLEAIRHARHTVLDDVFGVRAAA